MPNMFLHMVHRHINAHCVDMNLAMLYINVNKLGYIFLENPNGNHL